MDDPREPSRCGVCGRPLDAGHGHGEGAGSPEKAGRRVQHVVVALRGATAEYRALDNPSKTRRTGAPELAQALRIPESDLVGLRFSCWVTPGEYGVFQNDFRVERDQPEE